MKIKELVARFEARAWRYPKRHGEGLSFQHPGKCYDDDSNEIEPTPLYDATALQAESDRADRAELGFATLTKHFNALVDQHAAAEAVLTTCHQDTAKLIAELSEALLAHFGTNNTTTFTAREAGRRASNIVLARLPKG